VPPTAIERKSIAMTPRLLIIVFSLGLIAAACSDSDSPTQAASAPAPTEAPSATEALTNEQGLTESDALEVVEAYYTAVEAGDADAITALFADPTTDFFDENLRFEIWNAGQGMIRVDRTCTAGGATPEAFTLWACEFGDHQYLQRVAGAPATQIKQTFTVSKDGIEDLDQRYLNDGYGANDAFNAWMLTNHPEDAAAADCCSGDTVEKARANGELRRLYADLWVAYLTESGCTYTDIGC
jgi:hypothetical protein